MGTDFDTLILRLHSNLEDPLPQHLTLFAPRAQASSLGWIHGRFRHRSRSYELFGHQTSGRISYGRKSWRGKTWINQCLDKHGSFVDFGIYCVHADLTDHSRYHRHKPKSQKVLKVPISSNEAQLIVFYNPIIRYFVLNSLKLSICAAVALRDQDGEDSAYVYPFMILTVINVIPVVFFLVAYCKRDKLDEEATRKSIGAIYLGKNVTKNDHKAHVYPMIFFWRRSLFVIVTVCLFDQPTLQMIAHYLLTMLTVTALLADSTAFDS